MEAMHLRVGYLSTTHDSLWLQRDTLTIAMERITLLGMLRRVEECGVLVHARECLPTGKLMRAALSHAATGCRVRVWMARRSVIVCTERNILFHLWSSARFRSPHAQTAMDMSWRSGSDLRRLLAAALHGVHGGAGRRRAPDFNCASPTG
jgi:hypothetical protein